MPPQAAPPGGAKRADGEGGALQEAHFERSTVEAVQFTWNAFTSQLGSTEAAGRLVLSTFFDLVPEVQGLFSDSKSSHALKFMSGMRGITTSMDDPQDLKAAVEHVGFQHLSLEVTEPLFSSFTAAILDALTLTLADQFTPRARSGFEQLLGYVGQAMIYIRLTFARRVEVIKDSWGVARSGMGHSGGNRKRDDDEHSGRSAEHESPREKISTHFGAQRPVKQPLGKRMKALFSRRKATPESQLLDQTHASGDEGDEGDEGEADIGASSPSSHRETSGHMSLGQQMPSSFEDMFDVNAAVMGVRNSSMVWMREVLDALGNFVTSCSDSMRFKAECDVLTISISKYPEKDINLQQFRACLMAALRSLLSRQWTGEHEDGWTWLWDSVAAALQANMRKPPVWQQNLENLFDSMDDRARYIFRKDIYQRFFDLAPAGQGFFKQSNTRLHFIADRVLQMSVEMYQRPKKMVSQISALGLRHVGFGIPTELFPPFVEAACEVMRRNVPDDTIHEAFAWSLNLVAKILVRTIVEGSTVVMKAINSNSVRSLKRAIGTAPRKSRTTYLLNVQVGDQHISPLSWAIESGSMKVADAILRDILTIRADRARYYYGVDELWKRHPDIVKKLQEDAPALLRTLLDGLIWRSHRTDNSERRVNYYLKNLVVKADGTFADALECISASGDPSLVSHPTVALLADCLWSGVVVRHFIISRMWNVISLLVFILSQELLPSWNQGEERSQFVGYLIFFCRVWNYIVGMGRLATFHLYRIWVWCRNTMRRIIREIDTDGNGEIDYEEMVEALQKFKDTVIMEAKKAIKALREDGPGTMDEAKKAMANREKNMYNMISFSLLLLLGVMCTHEPMFWCTGAPDWPTDYCEDTGWPQAPTSLRYRYSIFAMTAMAVHWLILIDLAVFSTEISAFLLVCGHVLGEVKQFLTALSFLLLAFGSSISILCRNCPIDGGNFNDFPNAVISLFAITVGLYQGDFRDIQSNTSLLMSVATFVTISVILLLNLLVAQLNRSYEYIYKDMLGFARLNRASLIVDAMESCSRKRFDHFVASLRFDQRLEFDQGDMGIGGGIALQEDSKLHVQTREAVRRYGGSTSGDAPWPEDKDELKVDEEDDDSEKLNRIEKLVTRILKRTNELTKSRHTDLSGFTSQNSSNGSQYMSSSKGDSD